MVERLFLFHDKFDKAMIYFIRNLTRNFLKDNQNKSMNDLPLENAAVVEEDPDGRTIDDYINNILMKMERDAQGFLLFVVPIVLRINVHIVNIDTSDRVKVLLVIVNA